MYNSTGYCLADGRLTVIDEAKYTTVPTALYSNTHSTKLKDQSAAVSVFVVDPEGHLSGRHSRYVCVRVLREITCHDNLAPPHLQKCNSRQENRPQTILFISFPWSHWGIFFSREIRVAFSSRKASRDRVALPTQTVSAISPC